MTKILFDTSTGSATEVSETETSIVKILFGIESIIKL